MRQPMLRTSQYTTGRLIGKKYLLTLVFYYDAQEWAAEYGLPASEAAGDFTAVVRRAVDDGSLNDALNAAWPMTRGHLTARTVEQLDADLRNELPRNAVSDSSEWWLEYRNPFNSNWARTGHAFTTQEAAEREYRCEVALPERHWFDLRIVEIRTIIAKNGDRVSARPRLWQVPTFGRRGFAGTSQR
jgi:hypothetical protein